MMVTLQCHDITSPIRQMPSRKKQYVSSKARRVCVKEKMKEIPHTCSCNGSVKGQDGEDKLGRDNHVDCRRRVDEDLERWKEMR